MSVEAIRWLTRLRSIFLLILTELRNAHSGLRADETSYSLGDLWAGNVLVSKKIATVSHGLNNDGNGRAAVRPEELDRIIDTIAEDTMKKEKQEYKQSPDFAKPPRSKKQIIESLALTHQRDRDGGRTMYYRHPDTYKEKHLKNEDGTYSASVWLSMLYRDPALRQLTDARLEDMVPKRGEYGDARHSYSEKDTVGFPVLDSTVIDVQAFMHRPYVERDDDSSRSKKSRSRDGDDSPQPVISGKSFCKQCRRVRKGRSSDLPEHRLPQWGSILH